MVASLMSSPRGQGSSIISTEAEGKFTVLRWGHPWASAIKSSLEKELSSANVRSKYVKQERLAGLPSSSLTGADNSRFSTERLGNSDGSTAVEPAYPVASTFRVGKKPSGRFRRKLALKIWPWSLRNPGI